MPHTPLLSRLATLTGLAARARATDLPTDELLDGAPATTPAVTRRAFLAGSAGAATLAVLGGAACADPTAPRRLPPLRGARTPDPAQRVVVVGAGLAGLTCAYRLRQQGIPAVLYEAERDGRLGGRCWSERDVFDQRQIAERGGELIDQSHTSIRQLARELGLPLDNVLRAEPSGASPIYWLGGARYAEREAVDDLKALWPALHRDYVAAGYPTLHTSSTPRGRALDGTTLRAWLAANVPGGATSRLARLLDLAYVIEYGAETDEQSALNLIYLMGALGPGQLRLFGQSNEKYKVRGGNDLLVRGMRDVLDDDQVRTNLPLTAIARQATGRAWRLEFAGGVTDTADRVVLALPFSILRRSVDYRAARFPDVKHRAIQRLGMGRNAKLALQFTSRAWTAIPGAPNGGDTFADTGYQATWEATRAQGGAAGILVNYTGGRATDAQTGRPLDLLTQRFLAQVAPVLPTLPARWNQKATFDDWPAMPWQRGSYSYYAPGQYTDFGGAEGEAVDGCHFAGEHTSIDAQGYLEGAVESGERAAREVLAGLGVIPRA